MGSVGITAAPARVISSAQTVANTGRWIKNSTNMKDHKPTKPAQDAEYTAHAADGRSLCGDADGIEKIKNSSPSSSPFAVFILSGIN